MTKETGKLLTVHQNRRWDDDFLIIKKLVEEQKLGHVFRIESRVHGSRGIPGDWRKEKVHGGGMVLDWAYICWIRSYICTVTERSRPYTPHLPMSQTRKWTMASLLS